MNPTEPLALDFDGLMRVVPIRRTAIYAAIKRGDLKATKLGKRTFFKVSDVRAWLDREAA